MMLNPLSIIGSCGFRNADRQQKLVHQIVAFLDSWAIFRPTSVSVIGPYGWVATSPSRESRDTVRETVT